MLHPLSSTLVFSADCRPSLLAAIAALAVYAVTLAGTYVYDDRYIVLADPRIDNVATWKEFWTKDYFNGGGDNLYRPLVSMSYAIQAKIHGRGEDRAWIFHAINWLLHAAVSAAVAELARRMTRSATIAVIAGVLFAVHPIHVEAVANIVGRAELMCGLGIVGGLVLFFRPLTPLRAAAIWGCFLLALLSKEQGMLLPMLLLAAIPLRRKCIDPPISAERSGIITLAILLLWTLSSYIIFRENILKFYWDRSFLDPTINPLIRSAGIDRILMPVALFGRYLALLIAPVRLLPDYGGDFLGSSIQWNDPYLYLGIIAGIAWIITFIISIRRRRWDIFFCMIGFAIVYGLIANLITLIGVNFAERLMYIPSVFWCLLAGIALASMPKRAAIPFFVALVLLLSLRTVTYARRWNDPVVLFTTSIAEQPEATRPYLLLAEEWQRRGDMAQATDALATARSKMPGYYRVWLSSAQMALAAGDSAAATQFAREAQRLSPTVAGDQLLRMVAAMAATRPTTTP